MNNDKNDPTHVGHAINNPVVAPILPNPPVFFVIEIALTASAVFVATRYDTIISNRSNYHMAGERETSSDNRNRF